MRGLPDSFLRLYKQGSPAPGPAIQDLLLLMADEA